MLGEKAQEAMNLAFEIHNDQHRKSRGGKIPYFSHLCTVAGMVLELGGTEDEFCAAILHDSVEDRPKALASKEADKTWTDQKDEMLGALAYLERIFGRNVRDIIEQLTDEKLPKEFKKLPLEQRLVFIKESREKKFAKLRVASDSVRKVKACDALHNLRSLYQDYTESGPDIWRNFAAGKDGTIWYYEQLARIFDEFGPSRAAVEMKWMLRRLKGLIAADQGE